MRTLLLLIRVSLAGAAPATDGQDGSWSAILSESAPVVAAFVLFLVFWRLMQGGQQHARAIREGDRLMALGRAAEALAAYETAVRHAPKNALGPSKVGIAKTLLLAACGSPRRLRSSSRHVSRRHHAVCRRARSVGEGAER